MTTMNRDQAAVNPRAAEAWALEKVANKLMEEQKPEVVELPDEDGIFRSRQRKAFLGLANEIRDEADRDAAKRDELGAKVWSTF